MAKPAHDYGPKGFWAYPRVFDPKRFAKRKRRRHTVILAANCLPVDCAYCGQPITNEENRSDIYPGGAIRPYHYECSWKVTLTAVLELGGQLGGA